MKTFVGSLLFIFVLLACESQPVKRTKIKVQKTTEDFQVAFNPVSDDFRKQFTDSINFYVDSVLDLSDLNGAFLLAKNGEIIVEKYSGIADAKNKLPFTKDIPVHVASISKVATALVVLRLVDQEKIELDKDIRSYLPLIPYAGITVRMLLNHRSGIPYYGYFPKEIWPYSKTMTNADMIGVLNQHQLPLYFPPDTQFSYCNTNYALLALIIEKVTKETFPVAMYKLLFAPLKMENTYIYEAWRDARPHAKSYDSRGKEEPFEYLDKIYGDKNMFTTPRDLLKLDKALYSPMFLSSKMRQEMFKGYSYENPGKSNYGLGMRLREEKGKKTFFFHTGWWHGNTGVYAHMRADTICMIVLSNHYTKKVFGINRLSTLFGSYPFEPLIDTKENYVKPNEAKAHLNKHLKK